MKSIFAVLLAALVMSLTVGLAFAQSNDQEQKEAGSGTYTLDNGTDITFECTENVKNLVKECG